MFTIYLSSPPLPEELEVRAHSDSQQSIFTFVSQSQWKFKENIENQNQVYQPKTATQLITRRELKFQLAIRGIQHLHFGQKLPPEEAKTVLLAPIYQPLLSRYHDLSNPPPTTYLKNFTLNKY
ncbi:hypothetical protein HOLleu_21937 [Holothuria leucospilota]|uniref:Uncharacterized protein n=1 Tax=Holothuria leucospilota TaxID=206669 RepID=A0A9Q1BYG2_HOLLE|nr:hypothetical protein HOLleu_21937 [Holothuria leucospilota]